MNPKAFIFLGLLFAVVLLISSTVAVQRSDQDEEKTDMAKGTDQAGGNCRYNCCPGYGFGGGCRRCCRNADEVRAVLAEAMTEKPEGAKETNQAGGGGRCRYGCCGGWVGGRCRRCCRDANEAHTVETEAHAMEAEVETEKPEGAKETNQAGGGGRCRYGCCGGWVGGRCRRCCRDANEAHTVETEAEP